MTPNLFVATQTLFSPHKWFKSQKGERLTRKTEHWDQPVPGFYEYIPGRGWYLVATDRDASTADKRLNNVTVTEDEEATPTPENPNPTLERETIKMSQPVPVKYSKVLKRYFLAPDYDMRKRYGQVQDGNGKWYRAGFFRLDDQIAWVECWDKDGEFIPGPYKLWCIDQSTGQFRHMLKRDDPDYVQSRQNSIDHNVGERRRSQDSRSTQYRSGPSSNRDGPSIPSTRANSIKALTLSAPSSKPASQANSRRTSPKRTPPLSLDKRRLAKDGAPAQMSEDELAAVKAKLRAMAEVQADTTSRADSEEPVRGRTTTRVDL